MDASPTRGTYKSPLHHDPEALIRARTWARMSKTDLAKAIPCSLSLLSEMESGTRNCTPDRLARIAEVLNCPVSMLERKRGAA